VSPSFFATVSDADSLSAFISFFITHVANALTLDPSRIESVSIHPQVSSISFVISGPNSPNDIASDVAASSLETQIAMGVFAPVFGGQALGVSAVCIAFHC
jgi:hypothetical protein